MADACIDPVKRLQGVTRVPGDKSIAHRALLCGALAHGWTRIAGVPRSADVSATIRALNACGVQTQCNDDAVIVHGNGREGWHADGLSIDCANSGTTMRLLMGILSSVPGNARLVGDESLSRRPMRRIADPLLRMGSKLRLGAGDVAPVDIDGSSTLHAIDFELPVPSAQVKTALLLAGLGATGRTRLHGRLDSRDHTERMLPRFGVELETTPGEIAIEGGQQLRSAFIDVPGDPSTAAFWIAAALITEHSEVELHNVCLNPTRTGFIDAVREMGASIDVRLDRREPEPAGTAVARSSMLRAITIDERRVPALIDELPLLAVIATQAHGTTIVHGARELRVKESDRIEAIAAALRAMGAAVQTFDDGFAIAGPQVLRGAAIDPRSDHRIAMAAGIAALAARGQTIIRQAQCVGVSYPSFFSTLRTLGGTVQ